MIISAFSALLFPEIAKAQNTNALCYETLVKAHLARSTQSFVEVSGYHAEEIQALARIDSTADRSLLVQEPEINFTRLEDGRFMRMIDASFMHMRADSILGEFAEVYRDTIARTDFRKIRKGADAPLRGNDPRFVVSYLLPAVMVLSGITGIISLFYIRSS